MENLFVLQNTSWSRGFSSVDPLFQCSDKKRVNQCYAGGCPQRAAEDAPALGYRRSEGLFPAREAPLVSSS